MCQGQKMSQYVKPNVDDLLAPEYYQLHEHTIHKIGAAMEALVHGAEKVCSTKRRQFQVHLNRARQAVTTSSDAERQMAIKRFARKIHLVTPAICNLFDKLLQHHERQLYQEVASKATSPRSVFAKQLALMKTAAQDEALGAANMTTDKWMKFHIQLSNAEPEVTTWRLSDTERVTIQLERDIHGITSNEQKRFKKEFSIRIIKFEAWWETIRIQALRKQLNSA